MVHLGTSSLSIIGSCPSSSSVEPSLGFIALAELYLSWSLIVVECEASFGYLKACFVITVDPFFVAQRQKQRRQQHVIWLLVALITVAVTIALSSLSTIVRELLIAIVTTAVAVVTIVVIVDQRSIGFVHHL